MGQFLIVGSVGFDAIETSFGETDHLSCANLKNAVIHGANPASFYEEEFGTKHMLSLQQHEGKARLSQFKALTQFNIALT